jgi:hypothetical protein
MQVLITIGAISKWLILSTWSFDARIREYSIQGRKSGKWSSRPGFVLNDTCHKLIIVCGGVVPG